MPRFFCEYFENHTYIDGDNGRHIAKSLRMRPGETLTVCDTKGTDYLCEIMEIAGDRVALKILSATENKTEPTVNVTLFQCVPKSDKLELIVQKSVELGVSKIVPVLSAHCVSRPDEKARLKKLSRLQKIADEAAGQSGRGKKPTVEGFVTFDEMLGQLENFDEAILFYELYGKPLKSLVSDSFKNIAVIIGPEGGFSAKEAEKAEAAGAVLATLGKRILRTETAPLAALTGIMLLSGNLE